jgi:hypothetical protein
VLIEPALCFRDAEAAERRRMSEAPILDVPKLNAQEMQQLQVLLFRYLVHKPGGFADIVTDKLVNKCQLTAALSAPVAEPTESLEAAEPEPPAAEAQKRKAKTPEAAVASE